MYNTTTALAAALAAKRLNLKAVCGSTTLEGNQIANCTYSASTGGSDALTIGSVTAAMVTLTINQEVAWRDKTIVVSVGAEVDGTTQYVPLGIFAVTDCKQAEGTTTITAYDAAYYALGGTYTPTVSSGATVAAVLSDVAAQCGLTLATLPAAASTTNVVGDLTGKTCRDMVGYLAALVGCNALIDRDGKLALRWFASSGQSYSPSDYYNAGLSIDGTSTLACIQAEVETTTTDGDGNTSVTTNAYTAGGTGVGISIQNPYMTQVILDAVWASIGGLAYTVGSCDIFHGLLVEPGDLVTITDKAGVAHTLAVMSLTMTIDGGCKTTLRATGESTTDAGAAMQGSLGGKVSQLVVDLAKMKQLIIEGPDGVTRLYGGRIDTKSLFAQDITATGTITGAKLNGVEVNGQQFHLRSQSSPPEGFSPSFVEIDAGAESSYQRIRLGSGYVQDGTDVSAGYIYLDSDGKIQMGGITIHFNGMSFFPNGIYGDLTGTASKATKADSADNASKLLGLIVGNRWGNIPKIGADGVMEVGKYLDFHSSDNADKKDYDVRVTCEGDSLTIPKLALDKIADNSYSTNTYTSFSGGVATGSVTVTKKLGVCYIIGTLTLSGKVSSWTTILGSSAIPAPQHGVLVPFEMSQWKASYAQALRGKITPDGELQLVYGAAGNYVINISYPID